MLLLLAVVVLVDYWLLLASYSAKEPKREREKDRVVLDGNQFHTFISADKMIRCKNVWPFIYDTHGTCEYSSVREIVPTFASVCEK